MIKIEDVWCVEKEILDVVKNVCDENGLRYSLFYGTLLGAIRHKGFIPWDDDIDIAMPRKDYNEFISIWKNQPIDGYVLQDYEEMTGFGNNFSKVRKNNTTFIQFEREKNAKYHTGMFIDIFPMDRVAPTRFWKKIQFVACTINMLFTREHSSGSKGAIGFIEKILLKVPQKLQRVGIKATAAVIRKWNNQDNTEYFCPCTFRSCKLYFPSDMFVNEKMMLFENDYYRVVNDADTVLRTVYGDYNILPPESERVWHHHPIVMDLNHNYEDIQ